MKKLMIAALALTFSATAFATETYHCNLKLDGKGEASLFVLTFNGNESVKVMDEVEGTEYSLDLENGNKRYKYFRDNHWDGYGGYIELRVPANFSISGPDATEEFNTVFRKETYSEIGHVNTEKYSGSCERIDN